MREEPLSGPVNQEGSQNVAAAAAGAPPGTVGSAASNKKPRSRTKVQNIILWLLFKTKNGSLGNMA